MSQPEYRQARFLRPPGSTEIILVRHGESRAASPDSPFPLVDGHGDPELHPNGREQAILVAERLKREPIQAIYASNLRRTSETAAPLCEFLTIDPIVERDLREVHLGEWEGGLFRIKAFEQDPVFLLMQEQQRWDVIPGAEPHAVFNARITGAISRIAARHPDQLVAAFVHGGVIGHIISHATGAAPFAFNGCENGSITRIVVDGARIVVRSFNDSAHLTGDLSGRTQMT